MKAPRSNLEASRRPTVDLPAAWTPVIKTAHGDNCIGRFSHPTSVHDSAHFAASRLHQRCGQAGRIRDRGSSGLPSAPRIMFA